MLFMHVKQLQGYSMEKRKQKQGREEPDQQQEDT